MKQTVLWFLSFVVLGVGVLADRQPDHRDRADVEKLLQALKATKSVTERVEISSGYFLTRPFAWGPLGEGADGKYDNDPLARTDRFDCMTYVETVLAAALSDDWNAFTDRINRIRYKAGRIGFLTRNHFPEVDWIPNNLKDERIFSDITDKIGGKLVADASTTIEKARWYAAFTTRRLDRRDLNEDQKKALLEELKEETKDIRNEAKSMKYIPFSVILDYDAEDLAERRRAETEIRARFANEVPRQRQEIASYRSQFQKDRPESVRTDLLNEIPSGVVVNMIHPNRPLREAIGTNMLVTHQGFLIRRGGVLYLRHAAINREVLDVPFLEYMEMFVFPGASEPRGFHVLEVQAPPLLW